MVRHDPATTLAAYDGAAQCDALYREMKELTKRRPQALRVHYATQRAPAAWRSVTASEAADIVVDDAGAMRVDLHDGLVLLPDADEIDAAVGGDAMDCDPAATPCAAAPVVCSPEYRANKRCTSAHLPFEVSAQELRETVPNYGLYEAEARYDELAQPSERVAIFKPSNGILFSSDFRYAKHQYAQDRREALLSRSWVHVAHTNRKIRYIVQPVVAAYSYGDVYVGVTEASVPWGRGACCAVDCERNEVLGPRPATLHCKTPPQPPPKGTDSRCSTFVVTIDLDKEVGTVECYSADTPATSEGPLGDEVPRWRTRFDLAGWKSARLFVSLSSYEDSIEFCNCT
tara:strand:+ start:200 stop:1228 length:1029 start_codon:yes stop_codon:yes gene_type:complete